MTFVISNGNTDYSAVDFLASNYLWESGMRKITSAMKWLSWLQMKVCICDV